MERISKKDGYVYLVTGRPGFETWMKLGKDPEDERWNDKPKKRNKKRNGC